MTNIDEHGDYGTTVPDIMEYNFTNEEINEIFRQAGDSHWLSLSSGLILPLCYAFLIAFGSLGNGLVCYVVARNAHMRTPRNIFIINLAISDLTLCLVTAPFNLVRLYQNRWPLGAFMCKFVPMCQGTNVFVSTMSITAIALDRFQVIVYPTRADMKKIGAAGALLSIWLISFLMASPLLVFSVHKTVTITVNKISLKYYMCLEDVNLRSEKGAYSVASMVVQYILPIVIVTIAHLRICNKLRYRMVNQHQNTAVINSPYQQRKNERQTQRKRRTNILLAMIAIVFVLSWLPLNVFNIISEYYISLYQNKIIDVRLTYIICHLLVLCSACLNPILYGWLNENFRNEFVKVLCCQCCTNCSQRFFCRSRNQQGVPVIMFTKETNGNVVIDDKTMDRSTISVMPPSTERCTIALQQSSPLLHCPVTKL